MEPKLHVSFIKSRGLNIKTDTLFLGRIRNLITNLFTYVFFGRIKF